MSLTDATNDARLILRNGTSQNYVGPITRWVNSMAAYAKSLNKRQLLTIGEEGFFSNNNSP